MPVEVTTPVGVEAVRTFLACTVGSSTCRAARIATNRASAAAASIRASAGTRIRASADGGKTVSRGRTTRAAGAPYAGSPAASVPWLWLWL